MVTLKILSTEPSNKPYCFNKLSYFFLILVVYSFFFLKNDKIASHAWSSM
ncbi:MAG: hypothetical protein LN575_01625 [Rickettsia endosymbiont of Gnoriste bilineata]|nr:hypothetical protein [Rickettsia endosymbiont of Gnoriste bilineata]